MHRAIAWVSSLALIACTGEDASPGGSSAIDAGVVDGSTAVDGSNGSNDGGAGDGGGGDAAPACSLEAPRSAQGQVQCASNLCGTGADQDAPVCCFGNDAKPSHCYAAGAGCTALRFECDKVTDCADGFSVCCLNGQASGATCPHQVASATGSKCISIETGGCGADQIEICTASQPCLDFSKKCYPLTAKVVTTKQTFTRNLGGCF